MNHPTYPLQEEERMILNGLAIESAAYRIEGGRPPPITPAAVRDLYNERRDNEFPGWSERYSAEVRQWATTSRAKAQN